MIIDPVARLPGRSVIPCAPSAGVGRPAGEDDMHRSRTSAASSFLLLALFLAAPPPAAPAQASPEPARVHKSVRGTLVSVDGRDGNVIMKADTGESLTWHFSPAV